MTIQQKNLILLLKSALLSEKSIISNEFDLDWAIKVAKKHQIIPLLYYGALNCGIDNNIEEMQRLFKTTCFCISFDKRQSFEINKLFNAFENEKIDYAPLKGSVIKSFYPKSEMRMMSDVDVLIRSEQNKEVSTLMEKLGYKFSFESNHELAWEKNDILIELHKRIVSTRNKDFCNFANDGWEKMKLFEKSRYAFSDEDFYIYIFLHLAKHYRAGGIGIRHMIDLWVLNNKELDHKYIKNELSKIGIYKFYKNVMDTLDVWFAQKKETPITDFITNVIFESGSYGNSDAIAVAQVVRFYNKDRSMLQARFLGALQIIFPSYFVMSQKYPILKKCYILLPFSWVFRWVKAIFTRSENVAININRWKNDSNKKFLKYQKDLEMVGLSFNLDEDNQE